MLPNSLRVRGLHFAFLFGPPRFIKREEASQVHAAVCDALGHDDLSFQYSSSSPPEKPRAKGFSAELERKEGRGSFTATIDNKSIDEPIRLLLGYTWPPSLEHAKEKFDMAEKATFEALKGEWQRVLAEVRLRAQCDTRKHDGLGFMQKKFLASAGGWLTGLGDNLSFCGVRLEVAAKPPTGTDHLEGPKRQLNVELLREDSRGLYLELMCRWPQISPMPAARGQLVSVDSIRKFAAQPSQYVDHAYTYLTDNVESLASD